ncbi:hypothetical protein HN51_026278 [Arachis hypogaea]|uniref:Uncharacterized protein n=2 Tax=Arachis hypogaea TaxID=3818 RepID=A0A445CHB2_ARAHY|nr:terpene synthase 10 [Arachis hypogaea]QHO28846.1 Myrcene synthase [Arachis hypogaea]RYR50319.1 hypothetical protein Ahy_A07g036911 isoform A [Arachis hypogaea]
MDHLPILLATNSIPARFSTVILSQGLEFKTFKNVPFPTQCNALNKISNHNQTTPRRSANFKPSIWHYDYIQSLNSKYKQGTYTEPSQALREEVRMMLCKVENHVYQLDLIDVLQRLGVAYHFKNEIRNLLDNIYDMVDSKKKKDLHATALEYRLLRQHGYDISSDVFFNFLDERDHFKISESVDIEGILSLYEASFYSLEGETILDEARDFTLKILEKYSFRNKSEGNYLSLLIDHSLEIPLHWRAPRWETEWFIHAYETRKTMNPSLLEFAKLDFNILQTIHQDELKNTSRWWRKIGLPEQLNFARDRLVESYFWGMGMSFEPDLEFSRTTLAKVTSLATIIDDLYDVYGTLEELELFTEAIDRWDLNTIDNLPDYLKICFYAIHDFVDELAFEFLKINGDNITPCLKKVWSDLCKAYFTEAKWYYSGYKPSLEEYVENAWISIAIPLMLTHSYFATPYSFQKNELGYLEEYCDIIRFSATITRLINDLRTHKRENEFGDVPKSIQCYMNENGASETNAQEHIKSMLNTTWKKMNKEAHNSSLPPIFIEIAVNLARMSMCMYHDRDGHTIQDPQIKNRISSLIFHPITDTKIRGVTIN